MSSDTHGRDRLISPFRDTPGGPFEPSTVVELLRWRALHQPGQTAYVHLQDGEAEEAALTYGDLDRKARAIAAMLQAHGENGGRALLLYPSGLDYVAAFFGCLYAGVVAVPAYPPRPARQNRNMPRVRAIVNDCRPFAALSTRQIISAIEGRVSQNPELQALLWLATDDLDDGLAAEWSEPSLAGHTLAFLQYTSGSTAAPKGVMVSHGNLLHNERMIQLAFRQTERSVVVGWLPLYHDMGLIGNVLQPLYLGAPCILMSPTAFLLRPFRWLQAISRYRATTSGGPNFAYDLCARKITPAQRDCLDLSSWTTAFNGAEPIRQETFRRFAETFAPCGFRPEAFAPCYGLAEATLMVSGGASAEQPPALSVDAARLAHNEVSVVADGAAGARPLVNCGRALLDQKIVIADPDAATKCAPGRVGEVWVAGASVTHGYWNRPEETVHTFHAYLADTGEGPFLRTGDLGFLADGHLFITGRLKDLIVIRGRNLYPQDIELTVGRSHPALRAGCGAAFSVEAENEERLVVVQEVEYRQHPDVNEIFESVRQALAEEHEVFVYAVVLIRPGTIAKTSSGKIRRHECRAKFLAGSLEVVDEWRAPLAPETPEEEDSAPTPLEDSAAVESWLVSHLAAKLGVDSCEIDAGHTLGRYGIDSLAALELMHRVETRLGVNLPMSSFLQNSTIAQLAAQIAAQSATPSASRPPFFAAQDGGRAEHPLTFGQQALWFLHQLAPEGAAYNVASAVRIRARLDVAALRAAFQALLDRHAALRTTFFADPQGKPVQFVHERAEVWFEEEDASAWGEAALGERLREASHRPFQLDRGPLLRVTLYRRAEREHVLLLCVHHVVADFWSFAVLAHELGILYHAFKAGAPAALPPLPMQYSDFARWQTETLMGAEGERLWSYWQKQLSPAPPALDLPFDRPAPPLQTFRGDSHAFTLPEELRERLKALGGEHDATLYMTLLACFQLFLHRYTGQKDILVGSPTVGRSLAEASGLIGYFVNPVVLRADLSGDPPFKTFLQQVRQTVLAAFEHQDYPFALLVERLPSERDAGRPPIFQVMFTLQKSHLRDEKDLTPFALGEAGARMRLGELDIESVALPQRVSQFDLTLMMAETDGGLAASLQYNTDLFDAETVARMAGHFRTLLENAVARPDLPASRLHLLSPEEHRRLLLDSADPTPPPASDDCLHHLFERQAARTPDSVALIYEDRQLTYAELNRRATLLAAHLRALGVVAEGRVGVCLRRGLDTTVALLGILKAGGAYVPLDPDHPPERLAFMAADAGLAALLTREPLLGRLPGLEARVVCLDRDWPLVEAAGHEPAAPAGGPAPVLADNLAYVIYTSGSTGRPKGVMVTHRSAVNCLNWMQAAYGLTPRDRFLHKTLLSFDPSVWELFWPLSVGASVVVAGPEEHLDPEALARTIHAGGVTAAYFVPSQLRPFVESEAAAAPHRLRFVICGGESLEMAQARRFAERVGCELRHSYGPTEITIASAEWVCDPGWGSAVAPLGRSMAGAANYVLDAELGLLPEGVAGELFVGGVGVARGYLNRPALTAERFIPDPFSAEAGARLYRTGDVARRLGGGELEYVGRSDRQVKVRGHRVELGEVEAALKACAGVREAVAVAAGGGAAGKRVVAYVVGEGEGVDVGALREAVKAALPAYMRPAAYVVLAELPLMPNGKIDFRALPPPEEAALEEAGEGGGEPRTPTEEILVAVWGSLLGVRNVGIYDNFFDLGGHSLLATQLMARVRESFRVEVALRRLFESPTVEGLARAVEEEMSMSSEMPVSPIGEVLQDDQFPLSYGQQRLWFLDQLEPGSAAYNIATAVRLQGSLNIAALERTFAEIVRRHETWRTTFAEFDGQPVQVISDAAPVKLPGVDLSDLPEAEREAEALHLMRREAARGFDLSRGPLFRLTLLRLGPAEHLLLLVCHHIISDGWSLGLLVKELGALYAAFSQGAESPLEEPPIQYADYAAWQREYLTGEVLDRQLSYWRERLAGAPVLELPADRPRPPAQSYRGATMTAALSAALTEGLRRVSRAEGVTLFMTLMAAFQVLMSRYAGQPDVVVGTPVAGRTQVETEGLMGFFVNTLAVRTRVEGGERFTELLRRVREATLGAYAHQQMPFEILIEALQPERNLTHAPLFQVMFALQNAPMPELELPGLTLTLLAVEPEASKFDLTLMAEEHEGGLKTKWEYSTDLFDAATIHRMSAHFQTLLESIVAQPAQQVSALPLLTQAERQQLLVGWNDTSRPYPRHHTLHRLFEQQVVRTPAAAALIWGGERLTYEELNRRANRLAHHLRRLGVGAEEPVAILMERGADMVVGLLGVLKAGGAYVPLDIQYPAERVAFMLEDSRARVVLTQRRLSAQVAGGGAAVVCVDGAAEEIAAESESNPEARVTADNLAYVIYTSGSTGRPKGVAIAHRSAATLLHWAREVFNEAELAGVLASTSICFDLSVFELFVPLACGGKVILVENALHLATLKDAQDVTLLNTVPSAMAELLRLEGVPASVRTVNLAGEPLKLSLAAQVYERPTVERLYNLYGPSEDTTYSTCALVEKATEAPPTIGRPVANTQVYLLDAAMQPVPVGVRGELHIGGEGLARGYFRRAGLTAERFIPDPFSSLPGARLYRTGDVARYLPDGEVEFLGRIDNQVKVRGFRIELGEIEAALLQHAEVREAAVVADGGAADARLIAYIVAARETAPGVGELRAHLQETLPPYMIPSVFVRLDSLPLTPNGKLDRRALPAPDQDRPELGQQFVAPRTPVEELLADLWATVLRVERVGVEDNFFELGGHSLLATQLIARVRESFKADLPVRKLFESPTVAGMASLIEQSREHTNGNSAMKIKAKPRAKRNLDSLLTQVSQLSDAEAKRLVDEKKLSAAETYDE